MWTSSRILIFWTTCMVLYCLNYSSISVFSNENKYKPIPKEYNLTNIIVLLRHGDRIQITKDLSDSFPSDTNLTNFWQSKLPTESTLRHIAKSDPHIHTNLTFKDLKKELYTGWDSIHFPYGQLTERGLQQLKRIGYKFWLRYSNFILYENLHHNHHATTSKFLSTQESLYFRSTNMCRTLLSLRAFLNGFFHNITIAHPDKYKSKSLIKKKKNYYYNQNQNNFLYLFNTTSTTTTHINPYTNKTDTSNNYTIYQTVLNQIFSPIIIARPKSYETMYPGVCEHLSHRREYLIQHRYNNASTIPVYYEALEQKLHSILNIPRPFNW